MRFIAGELWRPVVARPWARKDEDIFVYEARALVRAVEVLCAELKLTGCRVLCLVDNMSVALCFSRRRSKEHLVISLIRRLVAIGLTRNIKIHVRWIPSELNSSDAPSRMFDIDKSHSGPSLFGREPMRVLALEPPAQRVHEPLCFAVGTPHQQAFDTYRLTT